MSAPGVNLVNPTAENVLTELTQLVNSQAFITAKYTNPPIIANISAALALNGSPNLEKLIEELLSQSHDNKDYIIHNNVQILNIPLASVLLKRLIAHKYLEHIGSPGTEFEDMKKDTYKFIPGGLEDAYISSLDIPVGFASKWDARVKQIRDGLAETSVSPGSTVFSEKNKIQPLNMLSVSRLNSIDPFLKTVVFAQNNPSTVTNPVPVGLFSLGLNRPLKGGSVRNLHAPLYPKLVMNGGAHPFAVLSGGDGAVDNMVTIIESRINGLKAEYKSITQHDIDQNIAQKIDTYLANVKSGFEGLEKDLKNLREVNGYFAQYRLGDGLEHPKSDADLETLAKQSREITEKSLRLSKQFGKISEVERLMKEIVDQVRPRQ